MNEILLTMGMPVYNEEKYIGEAIESLLSQTYKNFVLIISDNASTDNTQQICEGYAKKDKRIVYLRQKENKGPFFNFRYVLEQAKTPFFMWASAHDKLHPAFIEKLLPLINGRDIMLVYPRTQKIEMNGNLGKVYEDDYTTVNINKPEDRYLYIVRNLGICNIFHGIWLTRALKNLNFNIRTVFFDVILLEQAALEGKFKQLNEVLWLRRETRKGESYRELIIREFPDISGKKSTKKENIFLSKILYIGESMETIFYKKYSLGIITKLWLTVNIIYYRSLGLFIKPAPRIILRKILSEKNYSKLKLFLNRKQENGSD